MAMPPSFRAAREPVVLNLSAGKPASAMLPIIDPANPDVHLVNHAPVAVFLSFGPNGAVGPGVPESIVVGSGQVMTLTTKEEVLAKAEQHLVQGGDQAQRAGFTMTVTGWATKAGSVVIYRGEASIAEADKPLEAPALNQYPRARATPYDNPPPATVWSAQKPQPQTSTSTAWPEGWPPEKTGFQGR